MNFKTLIPDHKIKMTKIPLKSAFGSVTPSRRQFMRRDL